MPALPCIETEGTRKNSAEKKPYRLSLRTESKKSLLGDFSVAGKQTSDNDFDVRSVSGQQTVDCTYDAHLNDIRPFIHCAVTCPRNRSRYRETSQFFVARRYARMSAQLRLAY